MLRIEQKQGLELRLSPQHVLFSTLLQLPVMALEQRLKEELEINPLLEIDTEIEDEQNEEDPEDEKDQDDEVEEEKPEEEEEVDWEEILNDEDSYEIKAPVDPNVEDFQRPDPTPVSLPEHLLNQMHFQNLTEIEETIGENIIWNINEDGYLDVDLEIIAQNLDVEVEHVERILKIVQIFDPSGIASRNLQECLLIQLREQELDDTLIYEILEKNFDDFKNRRFEKIARNLDVTLKDIKDSLVDLTRLNPKPGEGYITSEQNYIVPDMTVEKVGDEFIISLNDSNVPQLRINNSYKKILQDKRGSTRETKQYIKQRLESARWLINSIQQRKLTMLKVMKEIVSRQNSFFNRGPNFLKPMILKDIADAIEMDISTISRVTNRKYVQTDYGVFELKYFFTESMMTSDGEEISTLKIKNRLKEIIEQENRSKPLTDGFLAEMLTKEGVPIARRTVAKYREQLRIPVARLRREI